MKIPSLLLGLALLSSGCTTVQPTAFPVGTERRTPRPADAKVTVLTTPPAAGSVTVVAKLNVHIEKTFLIPTAFDEALPQLKALARQQGGEAVTNIEEKKSRLHETFIYNVTADAVVFNR